MRDRLAEGLVGGDGGRSACHGRSVVAFDELHDAADFLFELVDGGILAPLLALPNVEEVTVNGSRVFVMTSDGHKRLVEHLAPDEEETLHLIKRAIGPLGGRLDESQPVVECSLPDGSRLTAVIPPMSNTVQLSICRFVLRALTLDTLVSLGTLPAR